MNKAISSFALIKTNWDLLKRDYIENFVPFISNLLVKKKYEFIDVNTICTDFHEEYGLTIPYHPMISILERVAVRGLIFRRRSDRIFVPDYKNISDNDFSSTVLEQQQEYNEIIRAFTIFCKNQLGEEVTEENAESIFVGFLKEHDLDILFLNERKETLLPEVDEVSTSGRYLINSFIKYLYETGSNYFQFIVDISIGHIIANTLLCENYGKYQDSLINCNFYLDIGFLFSLFGINGEEKKSAYINCINLIKSKKAKLFVFSHTCEEFIGILDNCIQWLESRDYDISRANRTLVYFIENGYSSSDVEQIIISFYDKLILFEIAKCDSPEPMVDREYQINEEALQEIISSVYADREAQEYTILLDIKSISTIYKLRRGKRPRNISEATHVFVTTNNGLAYANKIFDRDQFGTAGFCIPTTLTEIFIATLIWINSPAISSSNKQRLIANSYAAMRPSRILLKKLVEAADRLRQSGDITDEQVILLKESRIAKNLLMKETIGDPERFADKTAIEILDEIRRDAIKEEKEKHQKEKSEIEAKLKKREESILLLRKQYDILKLQVKQIENIKEKSDLGVEKSGKVLLWIAGIIYLVIWLVYAILKFYYKYEDVDILAYLVGIIPIIQYLYFVITKRKISPNKLYKSYLIKKKINNYSKIGIDIDAYIQLRAQEEELMQRIISL